jgi:ADP-ribose pyrophosphatase YjhB (NUDIX family)
MSYTPRALVYKVVFPLLKLYWFVFRPEITGTRCLIECGGKLLLIRQTYSHMLWTLPGGRVERGETPEEAVRREVREEVGLELSALRPLGVFTTTEEYMRDTVHCFCGETPRSALSVDRDEVYEARWFDPGSLPDTQSTHLKRVLEMYSGKSYSP